jgi:hypothetical protein
MRKIAEGTNVVAKDDVGIISKKYRDVKPQEHFLLKDGGNLVVAMKGFVEDQIIFTESDWSRAFMYLMEQSK